MPRRIFAHPCAIQFLLAVALLLSAEPAGTWGAGENQPAPQQEQRSGKTFPVPGGPLGAGEKLASANVFLLPEGFAPGELTVPAGAVLLSVKKRVGARSVELELRVDGRDEVIWRSAMSEDVWRRSEIVRLRPGKYTLSAAGDAEWACRITAEPPGHS